MTMMMKIIMMNDNDCDNNHDQDILIIKSYNCDHESAQ